jgi:hypothetical protein
LKHSHYEQIQNQNIFENWTKLQFSKLKIWKNSKIEQIYNLSKLKIRKNGKYEQNLNLNKFVLSSDLSKLQILKNRIMNKFKIKTYSKIEQNYNLANSKFEFIIWANSKSVQNQKLNKFKFWTNSWPIQIWANSKLKYLNHEQIQNQNIFKNWIKLQFSKLKIWTNSKLNKFIIWANSKSEETENWRNLKFEQN